MAKAKRKQAKPKRRKIVRAKAKRAARAAVKSTRAARAKSKLAAKPRANSVRAEAKAPRAHHDMGGLKAGAVKLGEHDYALWEKRVDAMQVLLSDKKRGLINTDMLRRGIESLPPDAYDRMSYYERWIHSITTMMLERGVVTRAELDARIALLRKGMAR
jgi:hypothetical protein